MPFRAMAFAFVLVSLSVFAQDDKPVISIGSKKFTEAYILGEIKAQLLEHHGYRVRRKLGLGGTLVVNSALESNEIDLCTDYTGTISQVILKDPRDLTMEQLRKRLDSQGIGLTDSLGFNNTYALAVREKDALEKSIIKITDLKSRGSLRMAFNFEFLKREDGWIRLKKAYGLTIQPKAMEHSLIYQALDRGDVDVISIYSTDAKIRRFNLKVLEDDLNFFPKYYAVTMFKKSLPPAVIDILKRLVGQISVQEMVKMNSRVEQDKLSFAQAANEFLLKKGLITASSAKIQSRVDWGGMGRRVFEHLTLTFLGILLACLVAIPLGVGLLPYPQLASWVIGATGVMQTIPSIALLAFMIPLFGIGTLPAVIALFLYSLLPIVRNTYVGLRGIDPVLLETSRGLGLYRFERLFLVLIPLGLPVILAGIRTATIITIGTATLAAFIGAGGLGEPIVTGLALSDVNMMMQGAVPATLLAIFVDFLFGRLENALDPLR